MNARAATFESQSHGAIEPANLGSRWRTRMGPGEADRLTRAEENEDTRGQNTSGMVSMAFSSMAAIQVWTYGVRGRRISCLPCQYVLYLPIREFGGWGEEGALRRWGGVIG